MAERLRAGTIDRATLVWFEGLDGCLVALLPAAALAEESFTVPLLVDFEDPAYQRYHDHVAAELDAVLQDGKLVAESASDAGSCRISTLDLAYDGTRATYVELLATLTSSAADPESMHGAGLMIRYAEGTGTSFLAFLAHGRQYDLLTFVDGVIGQRIRGSIDDGTGPLRLAAREAGSGAEFCLNEVPIGSFSDSRVQGSRIGLIHCGPGSPMAAATTPPSSGATAWTIGCPRRRHCPEPACSGGECGPIG